jgi:hypothetical protein
MFGNSNMKSAAFKQTKENQAIHAWFAEIKL